MTSDPFDVLGLDPAYEVDAAAVQRAYLARSARLHPDLAAGDPDAPRRTAELNEAKRILDDPERRADALLRRLGGPSSAEEKGLPDGFLMEIMETREAVEAALGSGDPAEREKWVRWAEGQRGEYAARVGGMFKALGERPRLEDLRAIRVELNAWRYIERLIEQLDPDYDPATADFRSGR